MLGWISIGLALAFGLSSTAEAGFDEGRAVYEAEWSALPGSRSLRVCPPDEATDCDFQSIAQALAAAQDGDLIVLGAGDYEEAGVLRANGVMIRAEPGAHMKGAAAEGKAALVIKGNDTVIEGLECSDIWVPNGNGACIRIEGRNLTLRHVYFHDSQEGILGGRGRILIEDSTFERLGGDEKIDPGKAHAIYIGKHADELILRRSKILSSKEEGHEIKSRAKRTMIENNVIASLDGHDSRLIDIPNGGEIIIRNNVLEKGRGSRNPDVIAVGLERGRNPAIDHRVNSILIEGNTIILERFDPIRLVHVRDVPPAVLKGNVIIGGAPYREGTNRWFLDRRTAGLPAYPHLQHWVAPAEEEGADDVNGQGRLRLYPDSQEVSWDGSPVTLTPLEFELLSLMSKRPNVVVSYEEIYGVMAAEGNETHLREDAKKVILALRRKFRAVDPSFVSIVYYPGQGFGWSE
jgi:hypothetical protein